MTSRARQKCIIGVFAALTLVGGIAFAYVGAGRFGVCTPHPPQDGYIKTVSALDAIVQLGLNLATALVGVGTALLLGWKGGIKLTLSVKLTILVGMLFLVQSALYAVWWRLGIAELWVNECLELVSNPYLGTRYQAHVYFFLAGLAALGILVITVLFSEPTIGDDT